MKVASTAPMTGPMKTSVNTHEGNELGSLQSSNALTRTATSKAQPANAFAGYQISGLDRVKPVLNPYDELGPTRRKISGMLTAARTAHAISKVPLSPIFSPLDPWTISLSA